MSAPWVLRQRQELRQLMQDYNANPCVKLNTSVAIRSRDMLPTKPPEWPPGLQPGQWIEWAERNKVQGKPSWKQGKGRIVGVTPRFITVNVGNYNDSILLANLHTGDARLI
jgi:hypothetical protein